MKRLYIALIFAALPFLLVWAAFLLTGFAFSPHEVFQNNSFWGFSVLYWFFYLCLIGFVLDMVEIDDEISALKRLQDIRMKKLNKSNKF